MTVRLALGRRSRVLPQERWWGRPSPGQVSAARGVLNLDARAPRRRHVAVGVP
jgi:hypothetical protein